MSERNTGLFVRGHIPPAAVVEALLSVPGARPQDFQGEEAPRVGHGTRQGHAYTLIGLRLFDVGGLVLMDQTALPGPDELEVRLGEALSRTAGLAIYLQYEDENAVGGYARFEGGRLTARDAVDGREARPVRRTLSGEEVLEGLDTEWVWAPMAEAIERAARPLLGPGVRNDDDLEAVIVAAGAQPVRVVASAAPRAATPPPRSAPSEPEAGGGRLSRLARRVAGKIKGR